MEGNRFRACTGGIALMFSMNDRIADNEASDNRDFGILCQQLEHSVLAHNRSVHNGRGFFLENSADNRFVDNRVEDNGVGVFLTAGSEGNVFTGNDFDGNLVQVFQDRYAPNAWSDGGRGQRLERLYRLRLERRRGGRRSLSPADRRLGAAGPAAERALVRRQSGARAAELVGGAPVDRGFGRDRSGAPGAPPRSGVALMATPGLRLDGICLRLGRHDVLRGVTLDCPPGSVTCLIGPNGAGKSTLLALAAGLRMPSAGRIGIGGEGRPAGDGMEGVAYLPKKADFQAC